MEIQLEFAFSEENTQIEMDGLPYHKVYNLTHYTQRYNWDCGLTCILMILEASSKKYFLKNFEKICDSEGFGNSPWTIDLCYVLKKFNIKHVYFTKTIGVDESYATDPYYEELVGKDKNRITKRFKEAESKGIALDKRTVDFGAFVRHLAHEGPIILLTNIHLLRCDICRKDKVKDFYGCDKKFFVVLFEKVFVLCVNFSHF